MSRRAKGEGTIRHRKDGRWSGTVRRDFKVHTVYGKTQRLAVEKLAELRRTLDSGLPLPDHRTTVSALLKVWIAYKSDNIAPSTLKNYEERIRVNIVPILGRRAVNSLEPRDLVEAYDEILRDGKSPTTVGHIHRVFHGMLKDGQRLGYLSRNVASLVSPPKPQKRSWTILTRPQLLQFLAESQNTTYGALWALIASTGMRIGEALALSWDHFDYEARTVRVEGTLSWRGSNWTIGGTKTYSSTRTCDLRDNVIQLLDRYRAEQLRWKGIWPEWKSDGIVFTNQMGKPLYSTNLLKNHFRPILAKAGLPEKMNVHDLRHTFATIALQQGGTPAEVAQVLGHSSPATTMRVYAHALPGASKRMSDLVVGD